MLIHPIRLSTFVFLGLFISKADPDRPVQPPPAAQSQNQPLQQANPAADPMKQATRLANITRDWMNGKLSTPGTSAEMREVSRTNNHGQLMVIYNVFISGAPKDQTYNLAVWPVTAAGPSESSRGLSIAPNGLLICAGRAPGQCVGEKKDDPVDFAFPAAKGEVFRLALVAADGSAKILFAVVPDPIIKKDRGCSLEAIRLLPKFELVLVRAQGFQPNEELQFTSKSEDEPKENQAKADPEGGYTTALLPFVKNKQIGKADIKLKGAACAPSLSFEWGK